MTRSAAKRHSYIIAKRNEAESNTDQPENERSIRSHEVAEVLSHIDDVVLVRLGNQGRDNTAHVAEAKFRRFY